MCRNGIKFTWWFVVNYHFIHYHKCCFTISACFQHLRNSLSSSFKCALSIIVQKLYIFGSLSSCLLQDVLFDFPRLKFDNDRPTSWFGGRSKMASGGVVFQSFSDAMSSFNFDVFIYSKLFFDKFFHSCFGVIPRFLIIVLYNSSYLYIVASGLVLQIFMFPFHIF